MWSPRPACSAAEQNELDQQLIAAAKDNGVQRARTLIRRGADVNAQDSSNGTGLIRAADRGHADVASRLVEAGVDVVHVNHLGFTVLQHAQRRGHTAIADLLQS